MSEVQPIYQAIFSACRTEHDSMNDVEVPEDSYWDAQTERSIKDFQIGPIASMPEEIMEAFGFLKKVAASVKS